jgi:hypothetical protein
MLFATVVVSAIVVHVALGAVHDIDLLSFQSGPLTGYEITGQMPNAQSGFFATSAGDFNGDGLKDVFLVHRVYGYQEE